MIEELAVSVMSGIGSSLKEMVGAAMDSDRARKVARRSLANELRFNLALMDSCLGDFSELANSEGDIALVRETVSRFETRVGELLFGGCEHELGFLDRLDKETMKVLKAEDLPHFFVTSNARTRRRATPDFSELLGFLLRKIAELRAMTSILGVGGVVLKKNTQWEIRLKNLRMVMLCLVNALENSHV